MDAEAIRKVVDRYIDAFNQRDFDIIASLFDERVSLTDWDVDVAGRDAVVAHMREAFEGNALPTASIQRLHIDQVNAIAVAELDIAISQNTVLTVVDVITLSAAGLIQSIRAYRGRMTEA